MLDFDGSADWIDIRHGGAVVDSINGAPAATLMGWFFLQEIANDDLISYSINNGGVATATERCNMDRNGSNNMACETAAPDGTSETQTGAWVIPTLQLLHLAAMMSIVGDTTRQFMDGVFQQAIAEPYVPAAFDATGASAAGLMSDANGSGDMSDGLAADCRCYERALSDAEIQTIHACNGHDNIVFGLRNRYKLNEGAPGVAASAAANFIKDCGRDSRNANAISGPIYRELAFSYRRRYP